MSHIDALVRQVEKCKHVCSGIEEKIASAEGRLDRPLADDNAMALTDAHATDRPHSSQTPTPARLTRRSSVTNGRRLFLGLRDGNSLLARRLHDLIAIHVADLGGSENCSEAEKALVRRAAVMILQLELMEERWHEKGGEASIKALLAYQRVANSLRRILESVGLQRRPRDVTPRLQEYLARHGIADAVEDVA